VTNESSSADPSQTRQPATRLQSDEGIGEYVGRYKVLRRIGEGGFGEVFEAAQEHPVRRVVALKVIRPGMDSREVISRFEAERQALALMDHPHIARVFDAGATTDGRPYFVMERVEGESIVAYCDRHRLSIRARLGVFEQVCQAVQHAHSKGVIHRDLKPGNILVSTHDSHPFAKVIDFGIAKAVSGRLSERTALTGQQQMIGTPLYMSPEQAEGSPDIDTRSDIYSLGVVLYELLTGTTPFAALSMRSVAMAEMQRIIREVEPPSPSARLGESADTLDSAARQRTCEPRSLRRAVRGELDWIVMKAIEKERQRRYETANGLALDVRRFLAGEPVQAAPPSVRYRMHKFVRRNKVAVIGATLVAASVLAGLAGFAWQANVAGRRASELAKVAEFQAEMLAQIDPTEAGRLLDDDVLERYRKSLSSAGVPATEHAGRVEAFRSIWREVNATDAAAALIDRTILAPSVAAIDRQFVEQPLVDAKLRQELADAYKAIGLLDKAALLQAKAFETRTQLLGESHADTLWSALASADLLRDQGELQAAEALAQQTLANSQRTFGDSHALSQQAMGTLASLLHDYGRLEEAEALFRQELALRQQGPDPLDPDLLVALSELGDVLMSQGRLADAEPYLIDSLERRRRRWGDDHPGTLASESALAELIALQGRLGEAEPLYRRVMERRRRLLGESHPSTVTAINNMGFLLHQQARYEEALAYFEEALDKFHLIYGPGHSETLTAGNNLCVLLSSLHRFEVAEPHCVEAADRFHSLYGAEHSHTLTAINNLAALRINLNQHAAAFGLLSPIMPAARTAFVDDNAVVLGRVLTNLGRAGAGSGHFEDAQRDLLEARGIFASASAAVARDHQGNAASFTELYARWDLARPDRLRDPQEKLWKQSAQ